MGNETEKMTIEKFQNVKNVNDLKEAVLYDFVEDTIPQEDLKIYREESDKIKRYMWYGYNVKKRPTYLGWENVPRMKDPDRNSELLQEVYNKIWPDVKNKKYMVYKEGGKDWIASDAMTTVTERINEFLSSIKENEEYKINDKKIDQYMKNKNQKISQKFCLSLYNEDEENYKKIIKLFQPLITVYHTIGNYCAVPIHFNKARSGYFASHDYLDLTLQKIYEYYMDDKKDPYITIGCELMHNKGNLLACQKWLDDYGVSYEGWKKFIHENYFQDYVDDKYEPKPLIENHNWCHLKIDGGYEKFVEETSKRIISRGIRLIKKLCNDQSDNIKDITNKIWKEMMAEEMVEDPLDAEIVVTDHETFLP